MNVKNNQALHCTVRMCNCMNVNISFHFFFPTYLNKNLQNSRAVLLQPLCPRDEICLNRAKNNDLKQMIKI